MKALSTLLSRITGKSNQSMNTESKYEPGRSYFKRHKVTFAEILKRNEKTTIEWFLVDGVNAEDVIEDVRPGGCHCTASFTWGGNKVTAIFTNLESDIDKDGQIVTKNIKVFFKDGKHKIQDGRGGMKWDPDKAMVKLSFSGTIIP